MRGRVAIVGAGLAGLSCARALVTHDVDVTVFEKGRSVGGRLSTRRVPPHTFDLGAQYFTARDERFQAHVQTWLEAGVCAPWTGRIVAFDDEGAAPRDVLPLERLVGTPDMSALARHSATGLDVRTAHRVERLARHGDELCLRGTVGPPGVTLPPAGGDEASGVELGRYDCVVVCVPSPQAALLLDEVSPGLAARARAVPLDPCIALGLVANEGETDPLRAVDFDGAFIGREGAASFSPLSWIARDSSKPGRPAGERWVLHASAAWSRASFDAPEAQVTEVLLDELGKLLGARPLSSALSFVRRWSLARAPDPLKEGALEDDDARVLLGGDWACGGRVEGAFLSGLSLAQRALARLDVGV